jgi:AcrR family transcriptional regulator
MSNATPLRRVPRQIRAQERVQRVLDAAEQVFAEVGFEAATTNAIALAAGTSIGSIYEFFPNKEAVGAALAGRYIERIGALYDSIVVDTPGVVGPDLIEQIVTALDDFYREHPGTLPLLNGRFTSPHLVAAGEALQNAFVDHIAAIIAARRADTPSATVRLVSQVVAEITRGLLMLANQVPLHQRRAVMRELERVVTGYMRDAMGASTTLTNTTHTNTTHTNTTRATNSDDVAGVRLVRGDPA